MVNVGKAKVDIDRAVMPIYEDLVVRDDDQTAEVQAMYSRLKIDRANIDGEAEENAALLARIGMIAEEAEADTLYMEHQLDIAKAEADNRIRASADSKPTEDFIKKAIILDKDVQDAEDAYMSARRVARLIGVVYKAFASRKDMIAELQRNKRKEAAAYGED